MCTKYEVSMSNAVPGGGVHDHDDDDTNDASNDKQSMIEKALWLIN